MSGNATTSLEVEIFGRSYQVRGHQDPDELRALASFVDSKMREVAAHVSTVDTARIAILTALNIAEELFRVRGGGDVDLGEKVTGLVSELQEALDV